MTNDYKNMYNDKKTGHWFHVYAVDIDTRQLTNKVLLSLSYAYNIMRLANKKADRFEL